MENIIKMFVSGSSAEGQSYANHFRHDNQLQDFDFMLEVCALNSNDQLVLINNAPGFVLVKWSSENVTKDLPHNSQFVDGFRMKQQFADHYISSVNASPLLASQFNTTTGTASIEATIQSDLIHQATKFHNALKYVETLQSDENKKKKFIEYHEWCEDNISNIFDKCLPELPMYDYFGKNYVSDCFCMVSPAFGFQLSAEHRKRAESVLNFYLKYRHSYCISQQIYKYLQKSSCLDTRPVDADLVPSEFETPLLSSLIEDLSATYKIDLANNRQTNTRTSHSRLIARRLTHTSSDNRHWFYFDNDIGWIRYEQQAENQIEQAFQCYRSGQGSFTVDIRLPGRSDTHQFNFLKGQQRIKSTTMTANIKRE
ncbi:unnamed protein product [Adineta ricciae]|uniref:WWE domain-containing protein n=1 Tax=Adineta ricciae TaxID=249248 RepID=A0A814W864_ADIRI|nr:unnamed protein product [Adineta ricciae]